MFIKVAKISWNTIIFFVCHKYCVKRGLNFGTFRKFATNKNLGCNNCD